MSLLPSATSGNAEYGSGNGEGTENGQQEFFVQFPGPDPWISSLVLTLYPYLSVFLSSPSLSFLGHNLLYWSLVLIIVPDLCCRS